jgi:hypothetical protein
MDLAGFDKRRKEAGRKRVPTSTDRCHEPPRPRCPSTGHERVRLLRFATGDRAAGYRGTVRRAEVPDSRIEDIKRTSQDPRPSLRASNSCSPICAPRSSRSTPKHLCAVLPPPKSKLTEVWPHSHPPSELCGFGRETHKVLIT